VQDKGLRETSLTFVASRTPMVFWVWVKDKFQDQFAQDLEATQVDDLCQLEEQYVARLL